MANEEHLAILKQGVDAWNKWRKEYIDTKLDLRDEDLRDVNFRNADLSYVNLHGSDLRNVDLSGINLRYAILNDADFRNADLSRADLSGTNLSDADLSHAVLNDAKLPGADLHYADLIGANLSSADLHATNLRYTNLSDADLTLVNFIDADLRGADLRGASLNGSRIGWTVFGEVDLSEVKGLDTVSHDGPSIIGVDTIYKSKGKIPHKFLLDSGMAQEAIDYLLPLASKAIDFYSCFISYSSKDQDFAERLHADLQAKGVRCWFAPEDLKIGEPILVGIDKGIRLHDKLLLVLSEHSVASRWVEHEVESALAEELRPDRKTKVLFPISLDNAVMEAKVDWAYRIRQRYIGAFTHWKNHDAYQKAFERLLRDLKAQV